MDHRPTALLRMRLLDGSSVQSCTRYGGGPEDCDPPDVVSGETLTAAIRLQKVAGKVTVDGVDHNVLTVTLDMGQGAFTVSNIELDDATKIAFNDAVKAYFAYHPVQFVINRLDLTNVPVTDALRPNDFVFRPLRTPAGNDILQLFIMTGGRPLLEYSQAFLNDVPEPLPLGQSASLMIRSQVVFQNVLPASMSAGWTLTGENPGGQHRAWTARVTQGSVTGQVNLSSLNHRESQSWEGGGSITDYTYSVVGGNDVAWQLAFTTFTCQSDGQLSYGGSEVKTVAYNEHWCITSYPCFWDCTTCGDQQYSSSYTAVVRASLPLSITGSGRDQRVSIAVTGKAVEVQGVFSGSGPCKSDSLGDQVNQQIRAQLPAKLADKLSFSPTAITVFALKNLLFPQHNYICLNTSAIPGDMLLLGTFDEKPT
ncbi:hypothetical protein O7606_03545 [Micromonospora sp. WMMD882]|uniref:hypothetical protein n=1 Tax=Micromonospora sp. WMMD882 TaxID=3015151 RepID=UPI00248C08A9|nr:hypothetical protein [Micromonospora sp. WMMD882]WBB80470.1 hypothetical protein O7606_03545 [Micromonospora sp. WMMD882]